MAEPELIRTGVTVRVPRIPGMATGAGHRPENERLGRPEAMGYSRSNLSV